MSKERMSIDTEVEVQCSMCHGEIKITWAECNLNDIEIEVEPCEECIKEAKGE